MNSISVSTQTSESHKSALILIEYQNDWVASTGSINPQFQDRKQFDDAVVNAGQVLAEARRRNMEVIHVAMVLEPSCCRSRLRPRWSAMTRRC